MLSYSLGISASGWVWSLQSLINPLIVGRFAGEAAVGYVALAIRLVDVLGFAKAATYRISIAALAKVQGDRDRLRRAVTEGMGLQILVLDLCLLGRLGSVLMYCRWCLAIAGTQSWRSIHSSHCVT